MENDVKEGRLLVSAYIVLLLESHLSDWQIHCTPLVYKIYMYNLNKCLLTFFWLGHYTREVGGLTILASVLNDVSYDKP